MDDTQQRLILTVGLPRSGKTTWARKQGYPIVNPDSIRLALHGQAFILSAEGMIWEIAYLMAKSLFFAGHNTVIIDATNITEKRRNIWEKKFKNWHIDYQHFDIDKETCINRAKKDNRNDLIPIIERMAKKTDYIPFRRIKNGYIR